MSLCVRFHFLKHAVGLLRSLASSNRHNVIGETDGGRRTEYFSRIKKNYKGRMEEKGNESYLLWWKGIHIVGSSGGQTGSHSVWNKHKHERRVQEIIITFGQDSLHQLTGKQMSPVFPCIQQPTKDSYDFPTTSRWNPFYGSKLAKPMNLNWLWCFPR